MLFFRIKKKNICIVSVFVLWILRMKLLAGQLKFFKCSFHLEQISFQRNLNKFIIIQFLTMYYILIKFLLFSGFLLIFLSCGYGNTVNSWLFGKVKWNVRPHNEQSQSSINIYSFLDPFTCYDIMNILCMLHILR